MPNKTTQFLTFLGKDWNNSIPLKSLWEVNIYQTVTIPLTPTNLISNINNILNVYENSGGVNSTRKRFQTVEPNFITRNGTGNTSNLSFLAQKISMPTDSFSVDYTDVPNMGLRGGYFGESRDKYQSVSVSFFETNRDIFEFFLRPWAIAASYKGLIEDGVATTNIKANMDLVLYSKGSNLDFEPSGRTRTADWRLRKVYKFEGVVPISVPGDELSYEATTMGDLVRDVSFTFRTYSVESSLF
jgi:hypothetical protein